MVFIQLLHASGEEDEYQYGGTNIFPADAPVGARHLSVHLLEVITKLVRPIEPAHDYRLDGDDK